VVLLRIEIPLAVYEEMGGDKPFLSMSIRKKPLRIHGFVRAFIDTGSPYTIFSEREGLRLQFPYRRIKPQENLGLGGGKIALHPCTRLKVGIRDLKNNLHEFEIDAYFSRSTRRDKRSIAESQSIPNILGVDFLKSIGFSFIYNAWERIALLAKE
jgi:hypothetical protein